MELGESTEETARREVKEETGLDLGTIRMVDVVSGSDNFVRAANGDEFYMVTIVYETTEFFGQLSVDRTESLDFRFFYTNDFPNVIVKSHERILQKYLHTNNVHT